MKRTTTYKTLPSKFQKIAPPEPPAPLPLELKNPHPRDARIMFFDEVFWNGRKLYHVYFIDGNIEHTINGRVVKIKSVTAFVHFSFGVFDAKKQIAKMMLTSVFNPRSEYYGMTAVQIQNQWTASSKRGTFIHRQAELYFNGLPHAADSVEFGYLLNFLRDYPELEIVRTEMNLFCLMLLVSGQLDLLAKNAEGEYIIIDWKVLSRTDPKVCKKIWRENNFCNCPSSGKQKLHVINEDGSRCSAFGHHPLTRDLQDCNLTHYTIQLNIYRWLLKKFYGIVAKQLIIVGLHPNEPNYERIEAPIMEELVEGIMLERYYELYPNPGDFERMWGTAVTSPV